MNIAIPILYKAHTVNSRISHILRMCVIMSAKMIDELYL